MDRSDKQNHDKEDPNSKVPMFFRCVKILLTYWSKFKFGIIFKHWFDEKKRLSNLALLYAFLSKILKNGPDNATVQKVITRALPAITYI